MPRQLARSLAVVALACAPALAGDKPWNSDDILALRTVSDPRVSPDGRTVAYVVESLNAEKDAYQTDVWLVPTAAGGEARALASSSVADDTPRFSPDGRLLAFLSERARPGVKADDAAEAKRQIWLIRPDGGEAVALTSAPGPVSSFEWSRDGKTIAFLAREPRSEERRKREKEKDDAWTPAELHPWSRLWVIDVATREARQLTSGPLHVGSFSLSPDGRQVVISGQSTPLIPDSFRSELYLVPIEGGAPTALVTRTGPDTSPEWSPDGKWIAFVSQDGRDEEWYTNSYACVVAASGGAPRNLTAGFDEEIGSLGWTPDSSALVFSALERTAGHLYRVSLEGRVEPLTKGPEVNTGFSLDEAGETLVYLRQDSVTPREVWTLRLARAASKARAAAPVPPRRLTDTNPQLRELLAFPKQLVHWKGADGWDMEGLLVLPPGYAEGSRVPLALNVHGGPAGTHSNAFTPAPRVWGWPLFSQAGYAIFFPNPRGSGGYGEKFRAANVRDWGVKDYEDIMSGVDALVARGIADPERLTVNGWSYGGFMTSTVVTKTDRFKSAIVGAAVTNLASFTGTADIPEFARSYFRAWPWEDPAVYVERSALFHAGKVKTPSLVVHGDRDDRVPVTQGWEFYNALRLRGVPTELLILPRQPHGIREPKLLRTCHEWFLRWTEKYTRGR